MQCYLEELTPLPTLPYPCPPCRSLATAAMQMAEIRACPNAHVKLCIRFSSSSPFFFSSSLFELKWDCERASERARKGLLLMVALMLCKRAGICLLSLQHCPAAPASYLATIFQLSSHESCRRPLSGTGTRPGRAKKPPKISTCQERILVSKRKVVR